MRKILAILALLIATPAAAQNYSATAGSGLTFGSKLVSAVQYPQIVFCDPGTPSQCVAVNASGQMAIQAPPTLPLPTGAATSANQSTEITALNSIVTNTGAAIPTQSSAVPIGGVSICDGANGTTNPCTNPATVKAASTAAVATDKALVVALSPNGLNPCQANTPSYLPITATTSLVKVIATGVAAKKIYICQLLLTVTAADNVAVFEATTGTTCATSPIAVFGAGTTVATAANGFPFPANGGVSLGNGGYMVGQTTVANNDLCIGTSAATPLTGGITYVTQ
jgi:hypothetical protein